MVQPLAKPMTVAEFRTWAEAQPSGRFELFRGEVIAMAPERARHSLTKGAAYRILDHAVRKAGLDCTVYPDGMTVIIDEHTSYEPDTVVECGGKTDLDSTVVDVPLIVVEVLSPSTRALDTGGKLVDYFNVASVGHYLVVDALRRVVTHHSRREDGVVETRILHQGEVHLDPPGLRIAVDEFFIEQ